ncbi:MAG TPA: ChbG/HpnK family deacetylase [Acidobacteriaceae bacterium]|nr:ChbG/HpnK family deacetylase [Acidobacteriaceae bacterium]
MEIQSNLGLSMPPASQAATGSIIVNADDWGREVLTTDRIAECARVGVVSSVSAMVFRPDSERGAALAAEHSIDAGLHLNLSSPLDAAYCPAKLRARQAKIRHFLRSNRLAPIVYHPGLVDTFRYVVSAQFEEFIRLYGHPPLRVDGHHHMHLCTNMLFSDFVPEGIVVRRCLSHLDGEMSWPMRVYRAWQHRTLARRHPMTDFFFNIMPLEPDRLKLIVASARRGTVEIMTHLRSDVEYQFLSGGGLTQYLGSVKVSRKYTLANKEALGAAHAC